MCLIVDRYGDDHRWEGTSEEDAGRQASSEEGREEGRKGEEGGEEGGQESGQEVNDSLLRWTVLITKTPR